MRKTRMTPIGANAFAVRVDSFKNGEARGEFCAPGSVAPVEFSSLVGLILMIDEILDTEDAADMPVMRQSKMSFNPNVEIEALFRQNHSWQGSIRLLDKEREATFRSVLELLVIIETVFGE